MVPGHGHACLITGSLRPPDGPPDPGWPSDPREVPGFLGGPSGGGGEGVGRPRAWGPGHCGRWRGAPGRVVGLRFLAGRGEGRHYAHRARCAARPDLACVLEMRALQPGTPERQGACGLGASLGACRPSRCEAAAQRVPDTRRRPCMRAAALTPAARRVGLCPLPQTRETAVPHPRCPAVAGAPCRSRSPGHESWPGAGREG